MSVVKFTTVFLESYLPRYRQIDTLIACAKKLSQLGILEGSSGNMSFRTKKGFLITCANTELGKLGSRPLEYEFAEVLDLQELASGIMCVRARGFQPPSSESPIHWMVYRLRPEVKAVLHVHDDLVLGCAEELGLAITARFQVAGTRELMKEVERLLLECPGVQYFVLRQHGTVAIGQSIKQAYGLTRKIHSMAVGINKEEGGL